ncbi:MAG: UDP-N-acetylglucosamine 1-carboxyvinyltransferase [Clostridia bacterium]|nr:UDP-N-acetylglucosamine 1-carboxyvinyltransferase [Clostridia bacterium]
MTAGAAHPGGCTIGARPIDIHVDALKALGIDFFSGKEISTCGRCDDALSAAGQIKGGQVLLKFPSVGATENLMIAASCCEEKTVIINAAREPEICDLQSFLQKCGVNISGAGTPVITVYGTVKPNKNVIHRVIPDRIEACTYITCAALCGDDVFIKKCDPRYVSLLIKILRKCGAAIDCGNESIRVKKCITSESYKKQQFIKTGPHPMVATDMQPLLTVLAACTGCFCAIEETVFANRFKHVDELCRMGAKLYVSGDFILCGGASKLKPAIVYASDLRCGAALVTAALCAEGVSVVSDPCDYIMRGYNAPEKKLAGAEAYIVKLP